MGNERSLKGNSHVVQRDGDAWPNTKEQFAGRYPARKKYIETIINSIAEPIIGLSKERKILFVNDEALTVLNLTRENIIDKPAPEVALKNDLLRRLIRQLVHPDDNKDPLKIYADNKESYFQVKYIPINVNRQTGLEGKYVGDVILLKNVTEFKEKDIAKDNLYFNDLS